MAADGDGARPRTNQADLGALIAQLKASYGERASTSLAVREQHAQGFSFHDIRPADVVVMAKTNPLAGSASLSASDIVNQPIVGYPKHARPILHEALWSGFRQIGAQPNIVCEIIDKSTMLQFVIQGLGISLVPAWVKNIAPSGVSFVPFEPCENQIDLYVAFRKSGNSDTVKRFVETVRATAV